MGSNHFSWIGGCDRDHLKGLYSVDRYEHAQFGLVYQRRQLL